MKRDMDLVRKILFTMEECETSWGFEESLQVAGYSDQVITYHVKLLAQAGLIEAEDISETGPDGFHWWAKSLTWEGHEFLEAAKDDTRWNKTKNFVLEKAGGLSFEALKFALTQGIKSQLFPGP